MGWLLLLCFLLCLGMLIGCKVQCRGRNIVITLFILMGSIAAPIITTDAHVLSLFFIPAFFIFPFSFGILVALFYRVFKKGVNW
jgi:peptidoglycan/LPS O-acetylase OafA/YrhL